MKKFLDIKEPNGYRTYQRTTVFLMVYAAKKILGEKVRVVVEHSLNKNYYCEMENVDITQKLLSRIEREMKKIAAEDTPIEEVTLPVDKGIKLMKQFGMEDSAAILKYRRSTHISLYKLDWFYSHSYDRIAPSTGFVKRFKLHKSGDGFILQFPYVDTSGNAQQLSELKDLKKITEIFQESNKWAKILKADTVGALNDIIGCDGFQELMLVAEALHEKKIAEIADRISQRKKRIVLIAGPSSSGKTTFAQRLCVQLRVNGIKPHVISLDDYYVNRDAIPLDVFGKPNFETIDALDIKQINIDLAQLIAGELVQRPTFNFFQGKREYLGKTLQLGDEEVLILEGIHGLNEKLTQEIPKKNKFKIFISALTQLNIDDHNRIPTTDTRLIRRIVRDNRFRGQNAVRTISMWPSVMRGEAEYIFPFQKEADAFFNSALIYELCVLKQFVEPLLFQIDKSQEEHSEARRLIKVLDCFLGVSSEHILPNSIIREFIGEGCFHT